MVVTARIEDSWARKLQEVSENRFDGVFLVKHRKARKTFLNKKPDFILICDCEPCDQEKEILIGRLIVHAVCRLLSLRSPYQGWWTWRRIVELKSQRQRVLRCGQVNTNGFDIADYISRPFTLGQMIERMNRI